MTQEHEIENFIKGFFDKIGWEDLNLTVNKEDLNLNVSVKTYEAKHLIGVAGRNLLALEHILHILINKKFSCNNFLRLDINDYRREKEKQIRELARVAAQKASQTKIEVVLFPMSSIERKIVHTELSSRPDVITESEGDAFQRRVVVKPYP